MKSKAGGYRFFWEWRPSRDAAARRSCYVSKDFLTSRRRNLATLPQAIDILIGIGVGFRAFFASENIISPAFSTI
jgi:hypothetical protein